MVRGKQAVLSMSWWKRSVLSSTSYPPGYAQVGDASGSVSHSESEFKEEELIKEEEKEAGMEEEGKEEEEKGQKQ